MLELGQLVSIGTGLWASRFCARFPRRKLNFLFSEATRQTRCSHSILFMNTRYSTGQISPSLNVTAHSHLVLGLKISAGTSFLLLDPSRRNQGHHDISLHLYLQRFCCYYVTYALFRLVSLLLRFSRPKFQMILRHPPCGLRVCNAQYPAAFHSHFPPTLYQAPRCLYQFRLNLFCNMSRDCSTPEARCDQLGGSSLSCLLNVHVGLSDCGAAVILMQTFVSAFFLNLLRQM